MFSILTFSVVFFNCLNYSFASQAVGIHLSSSTRTAIISSGKSLFETVVTPEGDRFISPYVSFVNGLPVFGLQAETNFYRKNQICYYKPIAIIEKTNSENQNEFCKIDNDRTVLCQFIPYSYLKHIKRTIECFSKRALDYAVIALPSHFSQQTKEIIHKIFSSFGVNLLSIIDENVAAALHHALFFSSNSSKLFILFNFSNEYTSAILYSIDIKSGSSDSAVTILSSETILELSAEEIDSIIAKDLCDKSNLKFDDQTSYDKNLILRSISKARKIFTSYPKVSIKVHSLLN